MKRNFDLIMDILKYFEERDEISAIKKLSLDGYDDNVVAYHVRIMYEAGFLDAEAITSKSTESRLIDVWPFGLTWEGHEFLDSIRQRSVLAKVKERLGGGLVDVPFAVIKGLAIAYAKDKVGL